MKEGIYSKREEKKVCPFTQDPFDDCYITGIDSKDAEDAINYCRGNFEMCEIYKKNLKGRRLTKWNVVI